MGIEMAKRKADIARAMDSLKDTKNLSVIDKIIDSGGASTRRRRKVKKSASDGDMAQTI